MLITIIGIMILALFAVISLSKRSEYYPPKIIEQVTTKKTSMPKIIKAVLKRKMRGEKRLAQVEHNGFRNW